MQRVALYQNENVWHDLETTMGLWKMLSFLCYFAQGKNDCYGSPPISNLDLESSLGDKCQLHCKQYNLL